jgi:hypothetical protein
LSFESLASLVIWKNTFRGYTLRVLLKLQMGPIS